MAEALSLIQQYVSFVDGFDRARGIAHERGIVKARLPGSSIGKRCRVRLVWLLVVLAFVSEFALAQVFLETFVQPVNCASGDAAVCLESLFYLE